MSQQTFDIPETAPFGPEQKAALRALLPTLSVGQTAWLSGYLAGMGAGAAIPEVNGAVADTGAAGVKPLTILYGSESGNAEACAEQASVAAGAAGFKPVVLDMGDAKPEDLGDTDQLLVIVSTWGEGDPPENAVDFHAAMMGEGAPRLEGTRFSVFALGDTSYADFCECGKQFDQRLEALGATRVLDRVDSDVDFEEPYEAWLKQVMPAMAEAAGAGQNGGPSVAVMESEPVAEPQPTIPYGKKNPFPAPVKSLINLNGRGSAKQTCHVELSLEGSGMTYEPGDVVGVIPANCPETVDDFLRQAGFSGEEPIEEEAGTHTLREVLSDRFDVTALSLPIMKKYAPLARNSKLEAFLEPDNKASLKDWLHGRELRDLFLEFPPETALGIDELLKILRKMPPRLYSIASSLRAHPDEVHLTVGAVTYNTHGLLRKGVCSTYLCNRISKGDTVRLYTHHNKNFFLPENNDTPIIMVGPGTGIAPFRAFIEERKVLGATGPNWLFFGDQHFNSDFLYQTEWQGYLKSGLLNRMDVAFSRDTDRKIYVQHRMLENARDLYAWMKEGAFFYVCGDASRMAGDVHEALISIYASEGGLSREAAETEVKELQKSKRYQRDVY
ncbi:MAG: assimilatory sulfite reductase (NADPH) flavoprotein subunit [Oceanipulchritudo sp.]